MSAALLPVWLPWFLCSVHSFTFECPKAAAILVCSLWSCSMLCWAWHAPFSPTCTYFYVGVLNASCASLGLQVHIEESLKIKGEYEVVCLHQSLCFGAQVEMEKIKTEHPDIQMRLWPFVFFFFFWQLWLLERFVEAACILLSNWWKNQKNYSCCTPCKICVWWHTSSACPVVCCNKNFGCFLYSSCWWLTFEVWGLSKPAETKCKLHPWKPAWKFRMPCLP